MSVVEAGLYCCHTIIPAGNLGWCDSPQPDQKQCWPWGSFSGDWQEDGWDSSAEEALDPSSSQEGA